MIATKQAKQAQNPYVSTLENYVSGVLSWKIPACKWVKLACERHKRDIESSKSKALPYVFDPAKADLACRFMEMLPHYD